MGKAEILADERRRLIERAECQESLKNATKNLCGFCGKRMGYAPGIGQFCKNKKCHVNDGPSIWDLMHKNNIGGA